MNGLVSRVCKVCERDIPNEEKALKSVMKENHWICIPCFEIKLGHKI